MKAVMGRIVPLIIALVITMAMMTSCKKVDADLEFGKTTTIEKVMLTPRNVLSGGSAVYLPKDGKNRTGYKADKKNVEYVTLVAKVKNTSKKAQSLENMTDVKLSQGGKEYTSWRPILVNDDEMTLKQEHKLAAGEEALAYFLIETEKATMGDAKIIFTFNQGVFDTQDYILKCDTSKAVSVVTPIENGKKVTAGDCAEITLASASMAKKIDPTKKIEWSSHQYLYPGDKSNILLDIQLSVKNLKKEKTEAHKLVGVKAVFDGKTYQGYLSVENKERTDLEGLVSIKPNATRLVHGVIEIPKELRDKKGEVYIYLDGTEYCSIINGK